MSLAIGLEIGLGRNERTPNANAILAEDGEELWDETGTELEVE